MQPKKVYVYGNGGMAKLFFHIATKNRLNVDGFCIEDRYKAGDEFCALPLISLTELFETYEATQLDIYIAIGPIKMNSVRERIYSELKERGVNTPNFICDSTFHVPPYTMGDGNIFLNQCCIHPGVSIGVNNFVSSTVTLGHGVSLGDSNFFAGGVIIAGETRVLDRCFFGLGVTVSDNLVIESDSFLGQGCVVTKSTEKNATYTAASAQKQKFSSQRFCDLVF